MNLDFESILGLFKTEGKCPVCIISVKDDKLSISRFSYSHQDISLDKYNECSLEECISVNQKKELTSKTLSYWSQIGYNSKKDKVYLLFPYEYANCQIITFPEMPKAELKEAIALKLTLNENEIFFFDILKEVQEDNKSKIDVLVMTVDKNKLTELINIVENSGFTINAIVPEPLALTSLFTLKEMEKLTDGCIFVEIHQDDTHVTAFNDSIFSFTRKLNIGKKTLKSDLIGTTVSDIGQVNIDEKIAGKILEEVGIVIEDSDEAFEGIKYSHIKVLQRPVIERYLSEFYRSFDYFTKLNNQKEIKRIFLTGESNRIKNLKKFLEKEFKIEVINLDSYVKILNNPGVLDLSVLLAVFLNKGDKIDLLPEELKYRPIIDKTAQTVKLVSIFLLALMIFLMAFNETKILMINRNIDKAESVLQALNPSLVAANKLEEKNKEYQEKKLFFKELIGNNILNEEFFIEISNLIPNVVLLNSLSVDQAAGSAEGQAPTVNLNIEGLVFPGKNSIADNLAELILNI